MSTELAVRHNHPERLTTDQVRYIANTDLIPKSYRGNVPAMMACILTGRALGIDDLHALRSIYVVDGKATLSAELMVTLTRQRGHSITGSVTDSSATAVGRRVDNGDEMSVTWTMDMAKRAGLATKGNWKNYPEAMLWSRAVSQLCRMLFSDVLLGLAYTADEMGDVTVEVPGEGMVAGEAHEVFEGSGGDPGDDTPKEASAQAIVADTVAGHSEVSSPPDTVSPSPEEAPTGGGEGEFSFESMVPETVRKGRAA